MITRVLDYMNRHPEGVDLRILDHDLRASRTPLAEAISWLTGEGHITITDGYVRLTLETDRQIQK